jgi:hypothetical protein
VAATFYRNLGVPICACGVLAFIIFGIIPVSGKLFFNSGEVAPAVRLAMSAQRALESGHFPLQFANDYAIALQPLFLYYTPVAYGLSAIIQMTTGLDAYNSLLVVTAIISASGAAGTYATIRLLRGDTISSGIAAGMFPFMPYFATDIFVRGAFAEISAWAVFPWVILFFVKFCTDPRWQTGIGLILTTALFVICHKIFFPWAMILLGVIGLMMFGWRRIIARMPLLLICLTAALSLSAPYWLNSFLSSKSMNIAGYLSVTSIDLTSDLSIFWPFQHTHPSLIVQYQHFSLQLGPVIVAALIVGAGYLWTDRSIRAIWVATVLSTLLTCSFFVAPSMWTYLPKALTAIQFPYRLLLLATTLGLILSGLVLSSIARLSRLLAYTSVALLFVMLLGFWWAVPLSPVTLALVGTITSPNGVDAYYETSGPHPETEPSIKIDRASIRADGNKVTATMSIGHSGMAILPIQYSRNLVTVLNGKPVELFNYKGLVSVALPDGLATLIIHRIESIGFAGSLAAGILLVSLLIFILDQSLKRRTDRGGFHGIE